MQERHGEPGPLGKLLALIVGAVLLVLGFMFSVVILAVAAVVLLVGGGWFWWKTRELRKALREHAAQQVQHSSPPNGEIIEGEAVVVEEVRRSRAVSMLPPDVRDRS